MLVVIQNNRGLEDIQKEMDMLASNFLRVYKTVDKDGISTGEVVSWISPNAEIRYKELQERCIEIQQAEE